MQTCPVSTAGYSKCHRYHFEGFVSISTHNVRHQSWMCAAPAMNRRAGMQQTLRSPVWVQAAKQRSSLRGARIKPDLRPRTKKGHSLQRGQNSEEETADVMAGGTMAEELSTAQHIITVDNFSPDLVSKLRGVFDKRFGDPRHIHPQRFMWDYWYCEDAAGNCQYNLVRTQAQAYFSEAQHASLVDALLSFGESRLGCRAITPIWVSFYTDGMMQEMHCDNPHGPFAFVLSLTNWEGREFVGGETQILLPHVLDYWSTYHGKGLEHSDLVQLVPPLMGRLTVFDPRFPHGVRQVRGSRDPRKGRLVLHGWFTDPCPFFEGGLGEGECTRVLNQAVSGATEALAADEDDDGRPGLGSHPCTGLLAVRMHVSGEDGQVKGIEWLADTLVPLPSVGIEPRAVRAKVQQELAAWLTDAVFPASQDGSDTFITLPVVFQ